MTVQSFHDLRLSRGVLHTPEGAIPLRRIGKGAFSTIYRAADGSVFAFQRDNMGGYDKEIAASAYDDTRSPHLPAIQKYGSTATETVYRMPFYKTPFRKGDSLQGWKDYAHLEKCLEVVRTAMRGRKFSAHDGYDFSTSVVECARESGVRPAVVEALDALVQTSANYGQTYWLEFSPRNLATDAAGHLILLDVLFDREALERARVAASRANAQANRW
jgi:hypothetical protein